MKLETKVLLASVIMSTIVLSPLVTFARVIEQEDPQDMTQSEDATFRDEGKTGLSAENQAKMEAAKTAVKVKKEEFKKQRETFALRTAKERFAKVVAEAEAGIVLATAKLSEAKASAVVATDRTSFEKARQLFMEARKLLNKAMRPLLSTPKVPAVTNTSPTGTVITEGTVTQ